MSIARALVDASTATVEACGLEWQIQRIDSGLIARQGLAALLMLPSDAITAARRLAEIRDPDSEEAEALREQAMKDLRRFKPTPEDAAHQAEFRDAIICAAVVAARHPGATEWDPLSFTIQAGKEDPDNGLLHLRRMPKAARDAVYLAWERLQNEEGELETLLASFREPAGPVASDGPTLQEVREAAS